MKKTQKKAPKLKLSKQTLKGIVGGDGNSPDTDASVGCTTK